MAGIHAFQATALDGTPVDLARLRAAGLAPQADKE